MADDPLRMQAEVVDKYSGPLKAFQRHLLDAARAGVSHSDTLAKGFGRVEGALQSTARSAQTILNPALAALGVTGLTAGVAVAGIASALRNLTGNLTALGQFSRETGVAADTLRVFSGVASKFNVDQGAVESGTKRFVANMREANRATGEALRWTMHQGTNPESRRAFQDFASNLQRTQDRGEALEKTLSFMETIKDPVESGMFAERWFGTADFGRLADGHLGKIADVWAKTRERMPPLDPKAILQAEEFERGIADLRGSMKSIGTTIAMEVLPYASGFTKWLDDIVKDQRGDFMVGLRNGLKELSAELNSVDWKGFGESAKDVILSTTALVKPLAEGVKNIAEAIRAFNEGKYIEGFRRLDGASGPLARRLAPLPGDDKIERAERVGEAEKRLALAREQGDLQRGLLKELEERGDKEGTKRLREAMEANARAVKALEEELRKLNEGATVKQSSAEGDGLFGGARVQTAAYRGGGGFRRFGGGAGGGGGSGPGYAGEQGEAGAAGRGFGGGRFNGLGGGAPRVQGIDPGSPAGRAAGALRPGRGGSGAAVPDSVPMTDTERNQLGLIMKYETQGRNVMNYVGRAQGLDPNTAKGATAQGYYQILNSNWRRLAPKLGINTSNAMSSSLEDQTRVALALLRERTGINNWVPFNPRLRAALARGERAPVGSIPRLTPPSREAGTDPDFFPNGAPRVLRPNSMRDAPGLTMADADRIRSLRSSAWRRPEVLADPNDERRQPRPDGFWTEEEDRRATRDLGVALRDMRRRAEERRRDMDIKTGRLDAAAARSGAVGASLSASGTVNVTVNRAASDTTIRTDTKGTLFDDVTVVNGRQMRKAD